jgi:hypothetical protein
LAIFVKEGFTMSTKGANERKFKQWSKTDFGGRLYSREVKGKGDWRAVYYKEVDSNENTVRFWQEIYDSSNALVEIHEKFPEDKGHRKIT